MAAWLCTDNPECHDAGSDMAFSSASVLSSSSSSTDTPPSLPRGPLSDPAERAGTGFYCVIQRKRERYYRCKGVYDIIIATACISTVFLLMLSSSSLSSSTLQKSDVGEPPTFSRNSSYRRRGRQRRLSSFFSFKWLSSASDGETVEEKPWGYQYGTNQSEVATSAVPFAYPDPDFVGDGHRDLVVVGFTHGTVGHGRPRIREKSGLTVKRSYSPPETLYNHQPIPSPIDPPVDVTSGSIPLLGRSNPGISFGVDGGVGGLSNFPYFDYSNDVDDIFGWNAKEDDAVEWGESDHRGGGKSGDCLVFRVKVEGTEKVEGTARIGTVRWVSQFGLEGFSEGCYNVATYSGKAVPKMKDDDVVDNGYLNNTLTNSTHFEGNLTHFNSSMTKFNGTVSATVSLWNTTSSTNTIVPSDIENATLYMNKTNFDDFEEESLLSENHWNTTVPVHKDSDPDNQNHRVLRKKPLTDDAHSGDWQTSLAAIYVVGVTEGGLFLHDTPISFRPKVSGYMIKLDPETGEHTGHYLFQTSSDVRAISYPISIDVFRDGGDVVVASMVSSNDDRNGSAGPWRYGSDFGLKLERLATSRWDGSDFGPSELKVQWDVSFGDGENNFFPPPTWAPTSAPTLDAQNASKTIVLDSAEPKENLNISQSFQRAVASAFVRAVRVTPNGSTVVVAGTTVGHSSNYPQDSVNTTHGNQKGFILKIDGETGEYINGTDHVLSSSNSNFDEEISGICVTNNAIFVVGHSDISNSIDGRAFQEFVVKLDLEYLEVIWKLDVYGKTDSFGGLCSLSQDSKRVYVSGTVKYGGYLSTTDKYSTESFGADDIFVLSINADTGSLLFLEQIGSSFDDFVSSESFSSSGIMSDEKNNAIVVGNTIGSLMGHGIGSTDIVVMNLLDGTGESVSPWVENNSPTNYIISWPDLPFAAKLIILILTPIMAIGLIVLAYICGQRKTLDRYNALRDRMTVDDSASVYSMNTADFYSDDDKQKHLQFTCDDGELTISAEKDLDNCPQLSELDLLPHTNPREGGLPLILEHLPISLPSPTDSIISDENKAMSTCSSSGKVVTCTEDLSLI